MTVQLKLPAIRKALQAMPWAIIPERGAALLEVISLRAGGDRLSAADVKARVGDAQKPVATRSGGIQVLQLFGVIAHRADFMTEWCGGTAAERFADQFDAAMADPSISAIVINADSPGGSVDGVPELAKRIYDARGKGKKIVAVSNTLMASAAYWIASAADEIVGTPSSMTGSIGVFMVHLDESGFDEQLGLTYTLISAGKYKVEGNPYEPLSDEARAALQASVDEYYELFAGAVAKHRGVKVSAVKNGYGEGRCLTAKQALAAGLIDRIDTLEGVLSRLGAQNISMSGRPRSQASARDVAIAQNPDAARESPERLPFVVGARADNTDDENDQRTCPTCGAEMVPGEDDEMVCPNGCTPARADEDEDAGDAGDSEATSPAGGAAAVPEETPEPTSPAPQGQEFTMANPATAAPTGAGMEAALTAERQRIAAIRSLGRTHRIDDAEIDALIDSGASVDAASARMLTIVGERRAAAPNIRVGADREAEKPFASFGEQVQAVIQAGKGRVDKRLRAVNENALRIVAGTPSGMDESVGSEGGFFIQPDLLPGVIDPVYTDDPILSRVTRIPIGAQSNSVKYNVVDETARTTGNRWGGVTATWVAEADTAPASKPKLRQMQLDLKKLMMLAYLTEELTTDAPASQALLTRAFQAELRFVLADAIFRGLGGGQPQGWLKSPALVTQSIEATQTIANSDTFLAINTAKMVSRVPASLQGDIVWVYNQELLPSLLTAKLGGTSVPAFVPMSAGGTGRGFDTIWGREAVPSELCEAVGTPGDLACIVPSQYHMADKGGPQQAVSLHVRFLYDEMALRITYRVDGAPVWKSTVTPYKSANARSPFVVLNTRA